MDQEHVPEKETKLLQELFLSQKGADGPWKIARYSFSPTNPLVR